MEIKHFMGMASLLKFYSISFEFSINSFKNIHLVKKKKKKVGLCHPSPGSVFAHKC